MQKMNFLNVLYRLIWTMDIVSKVVRHIHSQSNNPYLSVFHIRDLLYNRSVSNADLNLLKSENLFLHLGMDFIVYKKFNFLTLNFIDPKHIVKYNVKYRNIYGLNTFDTSILFSNYEVIKHVLYNTSFYTEFFVVFPISNDIDSYFGNKLTHLKKKIPTWIYILLNVYQKMENITMFSIIFNFFIKNLVINTYEALCILQILVNTIYDNKDLFHTNLYDYIKIYKRLDIIYCPSKVHVSEIIKPIARKIY